MDLRLGLIIFTIYCVTTVTPAKLPLTKSGNQCSLHCTESKNLRYQPGKTYIYDYIGKTVINSAEGNGQLIEVHAKAHVSVIDNCELSLQLKNVELKGLESASSAKNELEDRPIGFSYQDGSVASVCPSAEDSTWSINVKKAIISALQVSSSPKSGKTVVTEIDILGHCETQYEATPIPSSSNSLRSIRKTKNLRNCHHRQANLFSLFPTKYSSDSGGIQNLPILANEHSCSIEVSSESIISRVICTDSATLLPLSWSKSTSSGFDSMLTLTLEASVPTSTVRPIDSSRRQTLAFKHTLKESWTSAKGDVDQVINLLKEICSSVEDEIKSTVPSRFAELVYHLRSLSPASTSKLWSAVSKNEICPSTSKLTDLFTDALIMDGSEGSLKVIVELINEGTYSPLTVNYWLTLMAFASSPSEGSIKSLLPLIKNKALPRQSVLGVSSLVHNYCSQPEVDCTSSPIVNEVTRTLASRLAYKCSVSSENEDDTIVTLKGLANIAPYLSIGEIRSILECSKSSNSLFVRVTATETLQSVSCMDTVAPTMMELFTSTELDAELRIAAYKNVISCPSASKIEAIITTLENEPSTQVGSYVVSHLSNVQESADPLKSEIKLYLTGIKIPLKSFPQDIRKYSRYYELSQHFSKINLGAVVESDVIFDGSYIPRSIKANLSIPIFGSSINAAEIGFRQKGLESSIGNLFGPSGSLKDKNWREMLETLASTLLNEDDPNAIEANRYRLARRSVQWPFKPVKLESLVKKATISPSPVEGSMYFKVDGKTIVYLSVADMKKDSMKSLFDSRLENVVKSAKYDRAFSFMIMDSIHQFPGINGFPIKIDINSTALMGYKQTGKTIYPSFASQLSVKIGFDARTSQPGLKWVTTVNSAPALSAQVNYKNSIPVNVTLSLPKDSLTLFRYESQLISIASDNSEKPITSKSSRRHDGCTSSFTSYLGLELCGKILAPKPLFTLESPFIPFNGPITFDISLRKTDVSMKGWTFYIEIPDEFETENRVYGIGFNKPGSRVNSEYKVSLSLLNKINSNGNNQRNIRFFVMSPMKTIDASIDGEIGGQLAQARGQLVIDSEKDYSALIKLSSYQPGKDMVYEGELSLGLANLIGRSINIKSKATIKQSNSIIFIVKPDNGPAYIEGTMSLLQPRIDIAGDLRVISFKMSNTMSREKTGLRNNFNLAYRKPTSAKEEKFTLSTLVKQSLTGSIHKFIAKVEGSASKWPKNSFLVTWESSYVPWELIENGLTIETGYKSSKGYPNKSKITQVSRQTLTDDYVDTRNTLVFDVAGIFYKANLVAKAQKSSSSPRAKFEFIGGDRSNENKHSVLLDFGAETDPLFRSNSAMVIRLGSVSVNFADTITEKSQGQFIGNNELMISGSSLWTMTYNYTKGNDDNRYKMSRELDLTFKSPRFGLNFNQDGSIIMNKDEMLISTIGSNANSKLWSIDSKISQSSQSTLKIDLPLIGSGEVEVTPFAPNRLGYLKLSRDGYTKLSRFAYSPSSFAIDSELKFKSSLIYQLSGQYKSLNKWSTTIITKPGTLSVTLNPQNGKFDLKCTKSSFHHVTSFTADQSLFSVTSETTQKTKPILTLKTDYHSAGSLAIELVSKSIEIHSEANFKSADRLELESTLNLKNYNKIFILEGSQINQNVKVGLTSRGVFSVKLNIDSTENLKLNVDINNQGTTIIEIGNKPELKSFSLTVNCPPSGWEHSTLINHTPKATTIFSNTQKSSQRYFFVNGRLAGDISALDAKLGESESIYGEWSSLKGKGSFKLASGQYSFNHDSSLSMEAKKILFSSTTTKSSKSLIKVILDTDRKSNLELTISLADDHSLNLALESNSKSHNAGLKLISKSYALDHFTKINYAPSMDSFDLKSGTTSKGIDVATIKFQSTRRAPVTLEVYSLQVIGTYQVESSGGDKRYALKVVHPINFETEIKNKPKSSQFTVYSVYKQLNGEPIYEVDANIQPKSQSTVDVNIVKMKGHLDYTHWSSIGVTFNNGKGYDHQTKINFDGKTSVVEIKSSSSNSGSPIVRIDGYFDTNERMNLKVVKGPWDGSVEMNINSQTFTTSLTNQVKSLVHSTRASISENTFKLTSGTTKSSVDLFSLDCRLSMDSESKSEVKVSTPSWSSTTTYNSIKSTYELQFSLSKPSISSDYLAKIIYDSRASSLKLNSNLQRKGYKSTIESELNSSAKSWFKYSSSTKGRVDWEVNPFDGIKIAKISIDWKPNQFIHNSEIKIDQHGLKIKSTSSRSANSIYTFHGEIGQINGQSSGIEMTLVHGGSSYRHASSYSQTKESFIAQSKSIVNRETLWDVKSNVEYKGDQSIVTIDLDSPKVVGKATFDPVERSIGVNASLKKSGRKITLKTVYGPNATFSTYLTWDDVSRDPNSSLMIKRDFETSESTRKDLVLFEYGTQVKVRFDSKVNYNLLAGPHDISLEFNLPASPSKKISFNHEMASNEVDCSFRMYENGQIVHQLIHEMQMASGAVTVEIGTKSRNPTFDGLHLSFKHSQNALSSITSELKIQPSSGSPYSIKFNTESPSSRKEKSFIGKLWVKTPINQYRQQGVTINLSWTPDGSQSNANLKITRESGESVSFASNYLMKSFGGSFSLSLDGPLVGAYDGSKIKGQFDNRSNKRSATFESEIITIGSLNFILSEQKGQVEGQITVSSPSTSQYMGSFKTNMKTLLGSAHEISLTQNNLELFASKLTLDYGKPLLGSFIVTSKGSETLRFTLNRFDVSSEETKYIADYIGPKGPLKVNLNSQSTEILSQIELQVCPVGQCYNLQATDVINQWGRDTKLTYRNGVFSRVYSSSYIVKSISNDFTISGLINMDGVPFGGELLTTPSKSIGKIILAQRIIEARIKSTNSKFILDFMADAKREPSSKVTLEADMINQSVPSKGIINLNYKLRLGSSSLYRPISVSFLLKKDPNDKRKPYDSRIIFDLGKSESQSLIIESFLEKISSNNQSITFNIYQPGSTSKVNFSVKGHLGSSSTRSSAGLNWSWIDERSVSHRGFNLFTINYDTKEMTYIAHGGFNDISSRVQYLSDEKSANLFGEITINGKTKKGQLTSTLEGNCGVIMVFCDKNLKRKIETCYEPYQMIKINSQRFNSDSTALTDLSLMLSQRNGKVLKASMNLDPNYKKQLKSIEWPSFNLRKPQWKGVPSSLIVDEQIFVDIYDPISKSMTVESIEFISELDQHTYPLRQFVGNYVPKPSFNMPKIDLSPMFYQLSDKISSMVQYDSIKNMASKMVSTYQDQVDEMSEMITENWIQFKASVSKLSCKLYSRICQSIKSNLIESRYVSMAAEKVKQLAQLPCKMGKSISTGITNAYNKLGNLMMSNPDIRSLVNIIRSLYKEIMIELGKADYRSTFKSSISQYNYLMSPEVWGASARFTTWNPEKGMYEAEIVSPVDMGTVKSSIKSSQSSISDLNDSINGLKASLWTEMTPPFKSTAFLLGGQHFITFDGKSFDVNSVDCSYLLARDFVNGTFSVIVKYHGENKKSFLITLSDESVIEIIPSEKKVKLGRNNVELPVIQDSLTILRHQQSIVLQDSSVGLTFKCYLGRDLCSLTLSGWHFGRTKGLFGTYDYEPSNDYLLPNGKQATDANKFASGWEIEGSCANPAGKPVHKDEIRRSSKAYRLCDKLFTSSESPLADGFFYVSPNFYFGMCLRHMASIKGLEKPEKALCAVAGAYIESVKANGFELTMPAECLTCEAGQEFGSRSYISPTSRSSRADVIFVIEERPCNTKLIADLPNLARSMNKELEESGLKDPRFGVVGFGGLSRDAHGHTARGELFFQHQDTVMAIKRMELAEANSYDTNYTDALSAIVFASQYPFRKAASKNIVLLTCKPCDERVSRFDYNDIQHLLLSEGITLHVVSNQRFEAKHAESKTREIFGINSGSIQRASDIRSTEISDEQIYLRKSISLPKDVCISLAHLSNGSFYPSPQVMSFDHRYEKLWSLGLVRRVASTAIPHQCQHCDCVPDNDLLHSKILCRPCRPSKPVY